jgi:serine/threonine protein kinase
VRGVRVDQRTDIFSLGVVLYEMLAGFPPFRRNTQGDTLAATLHDDPPAFPSGDAAMPALERIVRHCLEKAPDERFQNVRDLIFDLESRLQEVGAAPQAGRRSRVRTAVLAAAALLALLGAAGAGSFVGARLMSSPPPTVPRVRSLTDLLGLEEFPAISPDGKMVAFTIVEGTRRQISIRYLASSAIRPVTETDADHTRLDGCRSRTGSCRSHPRSRQDQYPIYESRGGRPGR